jgi:hypothetical protein
MKKQLLLVALLLTGKAFCQNFTLSNEASVGSSVSMYICDTLTENHAGIKGANAVWDMTNLLIRDTNKRSLISVINPSNTTYKSLYTSSNKAIELENYLTSYYSSTTTERNCLGYFFPTKDLGDVRAVFNTDPEITHTYPFGLNSKKTDKLSGTLYYTYSGMPITALATGSSMAEVDGLGTLKFDTLKIYKNVLRYHIKDSVNATVTLPFVGTVDATLKRDQYEYYDHSISNLPIYTHSNLQAFVYKLSSDPLVDKTIVLSKFNPDKNAKIVDPTNSLSDQTFSTNSIYPNPAKDILYIIGENTSITNISISDETGKIISTSNENSSISIATLEKGVYFLQITNTKGNEVLKFIKE